MKEEVKEIIESGQLEAFVLGLLSPEEEEQVLSAAKTFPEVQHEIDRIAVDMESIDQSLSITPPEHVKEGIMSELFPAESSETDNSRSLPIADNTKFVFWRNLAAASIFLAVTSFGAAVYFGNMYYETNDELTALLTENTQMAEDLQFNNVRLSELEVAFTIT
jgi:anti-sigma-K factor RskA